MREYLIRPRSCDFDAKATDYLARDVIITDETIDIGLTDQFGNKIMARKKSEPVGFVHFETKT